MLSVPRPSRRRHCRRALPGLRGRWRPEQEQEQRCLRLQPRLHPPALPVGGLHQPVTCCRLFTAFGPGKVGPCSYLGLNLEHSWGSAGFCVHPSAAVLRLCSKPGWEQHPREAGEATAVGIQTS